MKVNKINPSQDRPSLTTCLLNWQNDGDETSLDNFYRSALPIVRGIAERRLRNAGIRDGSACDEVVSRVFFHIVKLHDKQANRQRFDPARVDQKSNDPAEAYVRWLTVNRSRDIIRDKRRFERKVGPLVIEVLQPAGPSSDVRDGSWMACISGLDDRSQRVVRLLLSGLNQRQIAEEIGACEGTVSRIRAKAIETMRQAMGSEAGSGNRGKRKPKAK